MSSTTEPSTTFVPILRDSNELDSAATRSRLAQLDGFFRTAYNGAAPQFYVCVPGRVNLIGEHIDYNGYPVLPMAIQQNILLAVHVAEDGGSQRLEVRNVEADKFEAFSGAVNEFEINLPAAGKPAWFNYVLCGIKGIRDDDEGTPKTLRGMRIAVSGNIPAAAGLSSSSALVCAATLAASYATTDDRRTPTTRLDAHRVAALAARCERHIGTAGGGMDQAIAMLARPGGAMFIDWAPLRASPVRLPAGVRFVIANSGAQAAKADAGSAFNRRVVECRLTSALVAKQQGLADWRQLRQFAALERRLDCATRSHFTDLVAGAFAHQSRAYSRAELLELLECTDAELRADWLTENTRDMREFWLYRRALHVVHERDRVHRFRQAAERGDAAEMGALMSASHESLATKYDCSHACLDRMVEVGATKAGVASRLTGAGWGGCIVALCRSEREADEYMQIMRQEYYEYLRSADEDGSGDGGNGAVAEHEMFATSPQGGAVIILNTDVAHAASE